MTIQLLKNKKNHTNSCHADKSSLKIESVDVVFIFKI